MPLIKSAKKKLRQDKVRQAHNKGVKDTMAKALKAAKRTPSAETLRVASQALDKATKHGILHKNKASRLKSHLAKHTPASAETAPKAAAKTKKAAPKKKTASSK